MKAPILRTAKDYNADPLVSPNLKFRTDAGHYYKVGYVLLHPDESVQYFASKPAAEATFATAQTVWALAASIQPFGA